MIRFCLVEHGRRLPSCLGQKLITVGFCLIYNAALVFSGAGHIFKCVNNFLRWVHILQLDGQHLYTRSIAVKNRLQKLGSLALDLELAVGDGRVNLTVADNLTHGRLSGIAHQGRGRAHIKEILYRVANFILNAELHIDDIFVASEH